MKLAPISPAIPEFETVCLACGKKGRSTEMLADLDGPAFRAYYHTTCVGAPSAVELEEVRHA